MPDFGFVGASYLRGLLSLFGFAHVNPERAHGDSDFDHRHDARFLLHGLRRGCDDGQAARKVARLSPRSAP